MATLIEDIASTDGVVPPDLDKQKAAGVRAIVPRATYGRDGKGGVYKDPVWKLNKDRIKDAGLKRSCYALLCMPQSKTDSTTPTPEDQMDVFIDYGAGQLEKPTPGGYCGDYAPYIDVEESSSLTADEYYDWVLRAVLYIKKMLGILPGVYDSKRVWVEYLKGHKAGIIGDCFPWYAKPWPVAPRSPAILDGYPQGNPSVPEQFGDGTWWGWYQYQGDAIQMPGAVGAVDLSRPNVIKQGAKGDIVRTIQKIVAADGGVDGDWGPKTTSSVKRYQAYWLGAKAADGVIGLDTLAPMSWSWKSPR